MILVDSDVLIAHLRGREQARGWLHHARAEDDIIVSVVTVAEIAGGMRSGERREVTRLLSSLHAVPVSEAIARFASDFQRQYRRSHSGIGLADYLIAATAQTQSADLATLDVRRFPMFPELTAPF